MACSNLTAGIALDCNDSNGSVEKVFLANGPVEAITETAGVITAITVGGACPGIASANPGLQKVRHGFQIIRSYSLIFEVEKLTRFFACRSSSEHLACLSGLS